MRSAALLLLATLAHAQERRLTGTIKTRMPDTVTVRLLDGESVLREKQLGPDGEFDWRGLKPGLFRLVTASKSHTWLDRDVSLYHARRDVIVTLEPGVTFRGNVARRNVPAGKTVVTLVSNSNRYPTPPPRHRETTCAQDGSFVFRNCASGKRILLVHHNYGMVGEDETDLHRHFFVELKNLETKMTLAIEPDEDVRLAVRLPDGIDEVEGRLSFAGYTLHRVPSFLFHVHRGKQDESRIFRGNRGGFYDFSAKRKAAFVRVPGFWKGTFRMALVTRGCREIDRQVTIDGPALLRFELEGGRGRTVKLAKTPEGRFEVLPTGLTHERPFGFLREGKASPTFRSDRYLQQSKTLMVTHGPEPLVLSFDFKPAPKVVGKLANAEGAPITIQPPDLMRLAMYPKWRVRNVVVKDGRFEVAALSHGSYEVRILDLVLATFKMGTESVTLDLKLPE